MTLHPTIAAFVASLPPSDATPPDVAGWRAMGEAHLPPLDERLPLALVEDRTVPASFAAGDADSVAVPVRVYRADTSTETGLLVYLHGGAFFSGSIETHDTICRSLAAVTGFTVVSVGYRLAPESAFPAGLDDSYAALRWAVSDGANLGWDGDTLALAGDSSGGTFVAALTARALDEGGPRITHQVLLYPSVDLDFEATRYPSLVENATGKGLETVGLKPHNSFYFASGADPADPRVSPIKRDSLAGLPRALVITAQYDPLRDEGEAYAARLAAAGVPTTLHRYEGATHGFVQHFGWLPEYQLVFEEIAKFVRA